MPTFTQLGLLIIGGIIGTLLRYSLASFTYQFTSGLFPWGTLAVNLSGCFVIGLLWGGLDIDHLSQEFKMFLFIGLLGAFTTFSTYSLESLNLFRLGEWKLAIFNILLSNLGGISFTVIAFYISRYLRGWL